MNERLDGFEVMRRNGDVYRVAVDPEDYERVMAAGPWYVFPWGRTLYCVRNIKLPDGRRRLRYLHVFILGAKGLDHIDGNGLNNCRSNLRPATHAQNAQNRCVHKNSRSGARGVSLDRMSGKWRAKVVLDGRQIYCGLYMTIPEAAEAASVARATLMPFAVEER